MKTEINLADFALCGIISSRGMDMDAHIFSFVGGFSVGAFLFYWKSQKLRLELGILREKAELERKFQEESARKLELQIKEISSQIISEKTRHFKEDSLKGMELLLSPFREKMTEFSRKMEEIHTIDSRDRLKLQTELERIVLTGQRMSQETENLTRALKGDVKVQGNWGEMILEKILEASGLRKGEEFTTQGEGMGLKNEEGRTQMPDVIINLPESKHLIIDSKVSLVAYERFTSEGEETHLKAFLDSITAHIKGLSEKNYQGLDQLRSPDYVMLFIPLEGAFTLAMQKDRELFIRAWEKNIVLVSPTTLLATLRTVASLWKQERQSRNALEMAQKAGAMYDKFVLVAQDLETLETQIKKVDDVVGNLKSKMLTGRGSVASRMEGLRELGAKATKQLKLDETA
jgi:DNA recombination protein RmuC